MKNSTFICFTLLVLAAFTSCKTSKKAAHKSTGLTDNGLIFSITTYDGVNETRPFVKSLGHTWVSLDNKTGHSVFINDYEIQDNEIITFSVWAITGHRGVYFNLEPNFVKKNNRYRERKSLSVNIDESKLPLIEEYINNSDIWTSLRNCSFWSLTVWNAIVDDQFKLAPHPIIYTPKKIQKLILQFDDVEIDKDFSRAKEIFHYKNNKRQEFKLCARDEL